MIDIALTIEFALATGDPDERRGSRHQVINGVCLLGVAAASYECAYD